MMNKELEYNKAKIYKRFFAAFIDLFCVFLMTFILFSLTNMVLPHIESYSSLVEKRNNLLDESHLYDENYLVITDVIADEKEFPTFNSKKDYLSEHIEEFYNSSLYFDDLSEIKEEYDKRRIEYRYNGIKLFDYNENNEIIELNVSPEYLTNFYIEEVNNYCLKYLFNNIDYVETTRIISLVSILNFACWLILMVTLFYLVFPLWIFKRGRLTIGKRIFSIGLINGNALNITNSKYILRFLFILFIMFILSFFSFLLPIFVSIGMMLISKRQQDLVDYIFNNYVVDIKDSEIYLDYLEYLDKNNIDKKLSIETKDLNLKN